MTTAQHEAHAEPAPSSRDQRREPQATRQERHFSLVWLVPVVAGLLVVYLAYSTLIERGPEISLRFKTADGIVPHETLLKYKSVPLGMVDGIELGGAHDDVVVDVKTQRGAKFLLTDHARFWVVRPRLSPASLSGLETIVSGAYISVDPGPRGGHPQREFTGLEEPPGVTSDQPGRTFELKANRIGSLSEGAPVFYRDVTVGAMLKYELGDGPGPVSLRVFIRAPYDQLVHPDTVFWNASGVSLDMGSDGVHFEVESLQALLTGGVAFETPGGGDNARVDGRAPPFHLYGSRAKAGAALFRRKTPCVSYLEGSVQGLGPGSAVQIFGVQVGAVTDVRLVLEKTRRRFAVRVAFDVQPERVFAPSAYQDVSPAELRALAADGLGVVVESSSYLTGQKVLSLEYAPNTRSGPVDEEGDALVLPSRAGGFDGITTAMADIAAKLDRIPFEEIATNLNNSLRSLKSTVGGPEMRSAIASLSQVMADLKHLVREVDTQATPALAHLPELASALHDAVERARDVLGPRGYGANSDVERGLLRVLDQVGETARSVRLLADFLTHHPEALLRGRTAVAGER